MINLFSIGVSLYTANVIPAFRMSNSSGQAIVLFLLVGSIFAWSIMVTKFSELKAAKFNSERFFSAYRHSRHPFEFFINESKFSENLLYGLYIEICKNLIHTLRLTDADFARLFESESGAGRSLKEHELKALRSFSDQLLSERVLDLEKNMGILSTAATAAPFLGLLGTVWGVMDAFGGLASSSSATLSAVAPGVSGALLTTVVGLVVALPSLIGYNILVGRIRRLTLFMERFVQELASDMERHFLRE